MNDRVEAPGPLSDEAKARLLALYEELTAEQVQAEVAAAEGETRSE